MPRHPTHLLSLARKGAEHRYDELKEELAALLRQFPGLVRRSRRSGRQPVDVSAERAATFDRKPRKRRRFSAATRAKMAAAQKRRWAKRKSRKK